MHTSASKGAALTTTPELPVKLGGGFRQPLELASAIQRLDAMLIAYNSGGAGKGGVGGTYRDDPPSEHSTPRTSRSTPREDVGNYFSGQLPHEDVQEWRSPRVRPHVSFLTKNMLLNERVEEKAQSAYYSSRVKPLLGPLASLSSSVTADLKKLKSTIETSCAAVGDSKVCEDRNALTAALQTLKQMEVEVQQALKPLGRLWTLLEFGNTDDYECDGYSAMVAQRKEVAGHMDAAAALLADIAARRRQYDEQLSHLKILRQQRMVCIPVCICVLDCVCARRHALARVYELGFRRAIPSRLTR